MGELFDRYVVVDWSASSTPKTGKDSIWIALVDDAAPEPRLDNPPTRAVAERILRRAPDPRRRTLVAIDASLGYPRGSAELLGIEGNPAWQGWWSEVTRLLTDDEANRNDRFEVAADLNRRVDGPGPFWGRPAQRDLDGLATTKPDGFPVPEFRLVEARLRDRGRRPASGWQLLGAGSVGSQTLTLLPILHRWFESDGVEVWPFTTGLGPPTVAPGSVVLAETWPTAFDVEVRPRQVRDAAQVRGVVLALRDADRSGRLAGWFAPTVSDRERRVIECEEGWVLVPD